MRPIRVEITGPSSPFYLEASKEGVTLVDGDDRGMALSNIAKNSTLLRFAIEDAVDSCKESPRGRHETAKKVLAAIKHYGKDGHQARLL